MFSGNFEKDMLRSAVITHANGDVLTGQWREDGHIVKAHFAVNGAHPTLYMAKLALSTMQRQVWTLQNSARLATKDMGKWNGLLVSYEDW